MDRHSTPELPATAASALDAESRTWLRSLRTQGEERERALERLHTLLLRAARREGQRRQHLVPVGGVELDDLCQQAADDAVVAVLSKLDDYRGASRFTTCCPPLGVSM
jgi:RNA polymerase sigma-70 factor (ECF subfamily)